MMIRSPGLAACAISIVPVVAALNKKYNDWLRRNAIEVQNALAESNTVAQEAFACCRTVIAFGSERLEQQRYDRTIEKHYNLNVRQVSSYIHFGFFPSHIIFVYS